MAELCYAERTCTAIILSEVEGGSTSLTLDASGNKIGELRYKPWGENRYTYGTTPTRLQYTGQRNDSEIGLYFYNARYYSPAVGRIISADTRSCRGQGIRSSSIATVTLATIRSNILTQVGTCLPSALKDAVRLSLRWIRALAR